jgi:hypothetical protein
MLRRKMTPTYRSPKAAGWSGPPGTGPGAHKVPHMVPQGFRMGPSSTQYIYIYNDICIICRFVPVPIMRRESSACYFTFSEDQRLAHAR